MTTSLKAIRDSLLDYLIHDDYENIERMRVQYPNHIAEIDSFVAIWKLSNKLSHFPKVNTQAALSKVLKQIED